MTQTMEKSSTDKNSSAEVGKGVLQRNYKILLNKFVRYLIPAMITTIALSINEFVDSMLVANLLSSEAMGLVNLGFPVMLFMATIYTLLGTGGSTLYAICLGERQPIKAGKIFFLTLSLATLCGVLMFVVGEMFPDVFIALLCNEKSLAAEFTQYFHALLFSAPFLVFVLTLVSFLPASGAPGFSTLINVVANVVNLLMDYVYITYFGMGVEGAAWATLTGYLAGLIIIPVILLRGKVKLHFNRATRQDLNLLVEAMTTGSAAAFSQLGFALKFAFCNLLAATYGGSVGIVAFAFCLQSFAFVSIFIGGIVQGAMPLLSVLHGERDFSGRHHMLKVSLLIEFVLVAAAVIWFEIAPQQAAEIYNITDPTTKALAMHGLRIFAVALLLRSFCITFMFYLQILQRKFYALAISLFDGFVGIIPLAWIFCKFMGLDGLWWTYLLNSAILVSAILLWNYRLVRQGYYTGILLSERDERPEKIWDFTMTSKVQDISFVSEQLTDLGEKCGLRHKQAILLGLAVEEMTVYTSNHVNSQFPIDILVRLYADRIEINFRSSGSSFSPLSDTDSDDTLNLRLLRNLSASLEYDYIMGMNSTKIVLARK
ncbi:MAG: polysaccharide biosynthesis C-terminal domain-containing protein [Selenomonadaceae bacterium]|nr:polysaccharide biosynthesis C-terminal domain-containing protein [Selenomonadaceae bacterium]